MHPSIQLYDGTEFDFTDPSQPPVAISVIAHALCRVNRFNGHTKMPIGYSVAQHSLNVMAILPTHLQLQGLMHDAHEALVGDVSAPLKMLLPDFRAVEARVWAQVAAWFGLPVELDPLVKKADLWMLYAESAHLMSAAIPPPADSEGLNLTAPISLNPRRLPLLKSNFLYHFKRLTTPADQWRAARPIDETEDACAT